MISEARNTIEGLDNKEMDYIKSMDLQQSLDETKRKKTVNSLHSNTVDRSFETTTMRTFYILYITINPEAVCLSSQFAMKFHYPRAISHLYLNLLKIIHSKYFLDLEY